MKRRITLLAAVPALALSLAACGTSNTDASPSSSMSSTMSHPSVSGSGSHSSSAAPSTSTRAAAAAPVISIADFAYKVPTSVAPGAKVTIKNGDSEAHTVTSKNGGFDIKIDPGSSATITAPMKPGTYTFVCTFHGNMSGTLVVQ
ncbi:cupredoxin domain-containing protein [Terrabacter carboxydivorans]|uniref:EfeO-type cupredoxin-like domain-containing protein n=1 Tax=Terrabacter carboxydivorans TaxID=619730 RepID=A0ABP5ZRQ1_9MICO